MKQVGCHLIGKMYADTSEDLVNKTYLSHQMKPLQKELQSMIIQPFSIKHSVLISLFSIEVEMKYSNFTLNNISLNTLKQW